MRVPWPRSGGLSLIRCLPITSFRQIITYSLSFAGTFDASHPAIELPSEQTITGTDYQQSQSLG
jgi:hypothetical protein